MLDIKHKFPNRTISTGFFDVGGSNMTSLFYLENNTFAITQLPYYQTALPVFYMYLKVGTCIRLGNVLLTSKLTLSPHFLSF